MKRGNDDEKIMGPMFPRLHVNDTEKGGPRAPPRNKMALYEQLTVPSQRYTVGSVPLNPNNNTNLVSSTSASQGMGRERNMCYPFYQPSLAPSYDELQVRQPETGCLTNEPPPVENIEKPLEEDDFMVPLFSQPGLEQSKGKTQNSKDGERHTHLSSNNPNSRGGDFISRQLVINRDGRNCRVDASMKSSDIIMREKDGGSLSEDTHRQQGRQEKQRLSSLEKTDSRLHQNHNGNVLGAEHRYGEGASELPLESAQKDISSRQKDAPRVGYGNKDAHKADNGMARVRDDNLLERENMDRGNDVSETSMVDCASGMDLSPDDVVGVIGRKHFWKARTAIANQQRVFAIQVFELHRLIKVQRLIAESPHLLLEGSAFVGKTSLKTSPVKKYSDYGVKAQAHVLKHKDNSQKPADKLEGTAENAVAKVPIPSQNATQPAGYPSFSVSPVPAPPVNADPKMGPWGFQQPAVHQWLVPVMSPSEGLVYKPYPAPGMMSPSPGMMSPMYGCCGPPGPSPMMGNMMNMPYVLPNPHFHQGMGMPPGVHFGGQGCFPTYAMPTMSTALSGSAVDQNQMNQFCGPNPYGAPTGQPAAGSANSSLQHQNSCNMSSQKNKLTTPTPKAVPPKERELQGSTASSPSGRPGTRTAAATPAEGTDTLCLFPTVPAIEVSEEAPPIENIPRVIKVVPHNAKSTKESAARIFQSIQAERRQYESS